MKIAGHLVHSALVISNGTHFAAEYHRQITTTTMASATDPPALTSAQRVAALREMMSEHNIDAYVIPTADNHNSEYPCTHDQRRQYFTGFEGSAGTAVVTKDVALLWTDGRYFIQAAEQLDAHVWTLMKSGNTGVPTVADWFRQNADKVTTFSADSMTLAVNIWKAITKKSVGQPVPQFVETPGNFVDRIWAMEKTATARQPALPNAVIDVLPLSAAGWTVEQKLEKVRHKMGGEGGRTTAVGCMLLSALDDVAWIFNLRGKDFEFSPLFLSFAIICQNSAELFCHRTKLSAEAAKQLKEADIAVRDYDEIVPAIKAMEDVVFMMDQGVAVALYNAVKASEPKSDYIILRTNYVQELKARKTDAELQAMRQAHLHDAKALCSFLYWLEDAARSGEVLNETEYTVARRLDNLRFAQPTNIGLSFPSISSIDANGAVIHYLPPPVGSKSMTNGVYLIDSGGQYIGGTTDVTRTVHLGEPSDFEKEAFTRVLKGHIALASVSFTDATSGPQLDVLARQYLWGGGMEYLHGTGHGVGAGLNVHEGPCNISPSMRGEPCSLAVGMVLSNEPGFYLEGHFGVRLENLVEVISAEPASIHKAPAGADLTMGKKFLKFRNLTLVPFQKKFMNFDMMTASEIEWVNEYHQRSWSSVSPMLDAENPEDARVLQWLKQSTEPIVV